MSNDIEDMYKRIVSIPRVVGFMVITLDGISIKTTLDNAETLKYCGLIAPLVEKARRMIKEFVVDEEENTSDDISFIRLRTKLYEILVAPEGDYAMIALQLPHEETVVNAEEETTTKD